MVAGPETLVVAVRKHYVAHLGKPKEIFEVRRAATERMPARKIQLATFLVGGGPATALTTVGISDHTMADGRRTEGVLLLEKEPTKEHREGLHRILSGFAGFTEMSAKPPRPGDVIRAQNELKRICAMDAILFLPPLPIGAAFHRIAVEGQEPIELLWLAPVYEAEASYALTHSASAFLTLIASERKDLRDLSRAPANTATLPAEARAALTRTGGAAPGPTASGRPSPPRGARPAKGGGSFDALDDGRTITIVRRPKIRAPRPAARPVAPPEPTPSVPPSEPPRRPLPSPRRPEPPPEPVIRFTLPKPAEQGPAMRGPPPRAQIPVKAVSASTTTPPAETEAQAKKRRVEELKAKAAEAAQRAAERRALAGRTPPASDS